MILVSACLAGIPCRWDGAHKANALVVKLVKEGKALPVCPEQLGGLTTPRAPAERLRDSIISKNGKDVGREFRLGAGIVLTLAREYGCGEAILKSHSPSCGKGMIYDGSFSGKLVKGDGVTTELLMKNGITVRSETELPL